MPDQLQFDYDVFISYSSHDKEWVHGILLKGIEKVSLRAFIDFRDFKPSASNITEMERGATACRKALLVLTPNYVESEWCEMERHMLQTLSPANRDLRLILLLKTPCEKPLSISHLHHIDFTEGADLDKAWKKLLTALDARAEGLAEKAIPPEILAELDRAKGFTDADKYSEAIPILEKALTAADSSGHTIARVKVRLKLGHAIYQAREDSLGAEQQFRDALVLVPIENLDLKHSVLHELGDMLLFSGKLVEAKATIHAALDVAKLSGKTYGLAISLISLSLLERYLGFHDSAIVKLDEAVDLLFKQALFLPDDEKKQNAHTLAVCYINKAKLCRDAGDLDEALAFYGKAEEQHRISGDKLDAGKAFLFCGEVHCVNADWNKGFDYFRRALDSFKEAANPLWCARALEHISRLYATHEEWEEALQAMLGAAARAEESGHPGEQVHFLCLAAKLLCHWKTKKGRDIIELMVDTLVGDISADKQAFREDDQVRDLLNQAKEIAQREHLHGHLANCLLYEAHHMTPLDNNEARRKHIAQAIGLLKEELRTVQFPKHRGHLMNRISALYWECDESPEALLWLKKAEEVFKKSGDAFSVANLYGSLAEMHHAEGRFDDEITAYRQVLSIIEGRSFYDLAAGVRINLASALQCRREFGEAQKLLNEAEVLCERHHFKGFIGAIARIRSDIENELQAAQAPTHTLPQIIGSLHQLLKYRPEYAVAYLRFWYFAWDTELAALLRSGPYISFMVVTDDVERFMKFAAKFRHLADHFLMTTSSAPTIKVETGVLPIPPKWRFPAMCPLPFMTCDRPSGEMEKEAGQDEEEDRLTSILLAGPATMLPQEAIDLMIHQSAKELIQLRAMWCPTERYTSKDPFLTDLRIGHKRGVFPVYFDRLPTSDAVTVCGGVKVTIPAKLLSADHPSIASKWSRALLKLINLPKDEAQAALLDLPEVFADYDDETINSTQVEIWLFEFSEIGQRLFHPAILIKK